MFLQIFPSLEVKLSAYSLQGVIHEGCPHKLWNFWDPPLPPPSPTPPVQACPHLVDHPPPPPLPVRADTRLVLFETLELVNNSH